MSALALVLAACMQLPRDAPSGAAVQEGATAKIDAPGERLAYALVKLSPSIVRVVNDDNSLSAGAASLARLPSNRSGITSVPITVGDIVAVTVFEAQSGGLFLPGDAGARSGNFVGLPNQQVDASGAITMPYIGSVKVVGLTPRQAADRMAEQLKSRAIEPQVIVNVVDRRGSDVSVIGEVTNAMRLQLDPGGLRLSGAIAKAGGAKYPDYDTAFTINRRGQRYGANLHTVLEDPRLDVQLQGGDVVYLSHDPRFVMVFGGTLDPTLTSITRRVTFESSKMNLAEAIAKAGGLNTARADPRSVFVMRKEPRATLARLGLDVSRYATDEVPTAFQINLAEGEGFFLADSFQLHNRDIIVVAESTYTEFVKAFSLLNQIAVVPSSGATIGAAISR